MDIKGIHAELNVNQAVMIIAIVNVQEAVQLVVSLLVIVAVVMAVMINVTEVVLAVAVAPDVYWAVLVIAKEHALLGHMGHQNVMIALLAVKKAAGIVLVIITVLEML